MLRKIIQIDENKCDGCGLCVSGCHEGALQLIDGKARLVSEMYCDGLGACIGECPQGAISFFEKEAQEYDEKAVIERLVPQGEPTVVAHLRHLKDHNQADFVHQAFAVLAQKGWDVEALRRKILAPVRPLAAQEAHHGHGGGCPGSRVRTFAPPAAAPQPAARQPAADQPSALTQWPVQLSLVPPQAPFFQGADLLVAADCVPFAHAGFHSTLLAGKALVIACPKLDNIQAHTEKLTAIFQLGNVRSVTVARMEVPCCGGLSAAVQRALAACGRSIPYYETIVSIEGNILETT